MRKIFLISACLGLLSFNNSFSEDIDDLKKQLEVLKIKKEISDIRSQTPQTSLDKKSKEKISFLIQN